MVDLPSPTPIMAKTALVTGATGLLGRQVFKAFQQRDWITVGTGLTRASPPSVLKVDVSNEAEVAKVLSDVRPDVVVHCMSPFHSKISRPE
jgi:S-adenosylmethionine synthetase